MGNNLPDDVSPSDIDDAYGSKRSEIVCADVTIHVSAEVLEGDSDARAIERLEQRARDGEWDEVVTTEIHDRYPK